MSSSPKKRDESPAPPEKSTAILLLGTIADTTWRMFVPTIGLTVMGVILDNSFGMKPWCTIIGIIIGVGVSGLLVWRQLRQTK